MAKANVKTAFDAAVDRVRQGADIDSEARLLYGMLTQEERLGLLDGDVPFWQGLGTMNEVGYNWFPYVHGAVERLGIPGIRFIDGPRGVVSGNATAFPVSMARGASWDIELEEEIGEAIGQELRARDGNFFGGVCINLPRHPAWGRIQETYGDDPYLLGEFGAALTRGVQKYVMACAKHYALNSMENARFEVDVTIEEDTLHEVYLPHFHRVVEEGVAGIMSAYNSVNGQWAGQNEYLLTEVLREQWGWDGITVSDFIWGLRDAGRSLNAGLDLEEPFAQQRAQHLRRQISDGESSWAAVDRSGLRLLRTQLRSYSTRKEGEFPESILASPEHRDLARRAATRSMVLLKNDTVNDRHILPINPESIGSIAVIGRLADAPNMGDEGSSNVHPPEYISPLAGIEAALPEAKVVHVAEDDPQAAADAAAGADVAVVVVGYDMRDEGEWVGGDTMTNRELLKLFPPLPGGVRPAAPTESVMTQGYGGDRDSLSLRKVDEEIIQAVAQANPRTVVAVVAAGAVLMEEWKAEVPGLLMMWYAGMEGGAALAEVLTGKANPSGRLPFAIPTSAEHLPEFDKAAHEVVYDRLHGQGLLDSLGVEAAFPQGFGLSYSEFSIEDARLSKVDSDGFEAVVTVKNSSDRGGHHVVQLYGEQPGTGQVKLVGFSTLYVHANSSADVVVEGSFVPVSTWDGDKKRMVAPVGHTLEVQASSYAHDPGAKRFSVAVAAEDSESVEGEQ